MGSPSVSRYKMSMEPYFHVNKYNTFVAFMRRKSPYIDVYSALFIAFLSQTYVFNQVPSGL